MILDFETFRAANVARQKEWDPGNVIPLTYRATELAGELGEACNVVKKLERERLGIRGSRDTLEHLAEELADVVICTDLIAMQVDIDLGAAVRTKFNATSENYGLTTRIPDTGAAASMAAAAELRGVLAHLIDHGKIELGTPQSKALIAAVAVIVGTW